jgi:hypothetical protein
VCSVSCILIINLESEGKGEAHIGDLCMRMRAEHTESGSLGDGQVQN